VILKKKLLIAGFVFLLPGGIAIASAFLIGAHVKKPTPPTTKV
jgi:hypothetical protein